MPTLGPTELILILVLALILFGAGKLKDVGGALGQSIKEFRKAATEDDPKPNQSNSKEEPPTTTHPS